MTQTKHRPQSTTEVESNEKNDVINAIPHRLRDNHDVKLVQDLDTGHVAVQVQVHNTDVVPIAFKVIPAGKTDDGTILYKTKKIIGNKGETVSKALQPIRTALLGVNKRVQNFETY